MNRKLPQALLLAVLILAGFLRFYRLDDSRNRETGGVGLGLAIAKWAVEAHGGNIRVDTANGGGSVFSIALPC